NGAIQEVLQEIMNEHGRIIFNGNGYSSEWHEEADKIRGLPNLRTAADALPLIDSPEVVEIFEKYAVLTKEELSSRREIYSEQYVSTVNVEANLVIEMGRTLIYPAAVRYLNELSSTCATLKSADVPFSSGLLTKVAKLTTDLEAKL